MVDLNYARGQRECVVGNPEVGLLAEMDQKRGVGHHPAGSSRAAQASSSRRGVLARRMPTDNTRYRPQQRRLPAHRLSCPAALSEWPILERLRATVALLDPRPAQIRQQ
jgi:hypothetical protein